LEGGSEDEKMDKKEKEKRGIEGRGS